MAEQNSPNHQSSTLRQIPAVRHERQSDQPKYQDSEKAGKWNQLEHAKYVVYLESHREQFKSKERRRASKFYKQMAKFIKSRNALQCRSHHQKLEDKYLYPNKIITLFKSKENLALYESAKQELIDFEPQNILSIPKPEKLQMVNTEISTQTAFQGINVSYVFAYPDYASYAPYGSFTNQSLYSMNSLNGDVSGEIFGSSTQLLGCQLYPYYKVSSNSEGL